MIGLVCIGGIGGAKWIDKIGDKIFFLGASADGFFFVFDDDFIVCDFDNFFAMDSEFGVYERFEGWSFDNDLLNGKIVASKSKI